MTASPAGKSGRAAALMVLALTIASAGAMRSTFAPVQDFAKAQLRLSDLQLSLVQGLALSLPIALFSIPLGRLVDRGNRMRLLMGLAFLWTAGTFLTAVANSFAVLFVARMLAGFGALCALTVAISLAADLTGPNARGRAVMLLSLGQYAGIAAAFALTGSGMTIGSRLFGVSPWRAMHLLFGLASILLILPLLAVWEPPRHESGEAAGAPFRVALAALCQRRALLIPLFAGQVAVVMADNAGVTWAAPVLMRFYHLQPEQFGRWLGAVLLLGGVLGSVLGGIAADLGQKSGRRGGLLIGGVVATFLSIPGALFPVMPTPAAFAGMLALLLVCGTATGLITAAALAVLVPNDYRGLCLGAFIVVGAVIGFGVAPTLVTLVSDALGGEGHLRTALCVSGLAASIASAAGFILALRSARIGA